MFSLQLTLLQREQTSSAHKTKALGEQAKQNTEEGRRHDKHHLTRGIDPDWPDCGPHLVEQNSARIN